MTFEGKSYNVQVHVPAAPQRAPLPLVLELHASNNNPVFQSMISGLADVADAEGFIVATPQGNISFATDASLSPASSYGPTWGWNVPGVPLTSGNYPAPDARDDVAFLRAVVEQVDTAACVDERSTAADYSAPAAGTCEPAAPVAVATFHGTADTRNPYQGNTDLRSGYSTQVAAQEWASLNECRVGPETTQYSPSVKQYTWSKCAGQADVVLYEVAGDGHTWAGSELDFESLGMGAATQEINASQAMWDFFETHQRRG